MAEVLRLDDILAADEAGQWVQAERYGFNMPDPEATAFSLTRIAQGAWHIAVRGYNDGQPLECEVDNGVLIADIDGSTYPLMQASSLQQPYHMGISLYEVTDEEHKTFQGALQQPEAKNDSLVQVLEQERSGSWAVMAPFYPDAEGIMQLDLVRSDLAGFRWTYHDQENSDVISPGGYLGYVLQGPISPAIIRQDGPKIKVLPMDDGQTYGLQLCRISERLIGGSLHVKPVGPMTDKLRTTLYYLMHDTPAMPFNPTKRVRHPSENLYGTNFGLVNSEPAS